MTNPNRRHIIFIMDRSGSIGSILSDMQGGYDQFVTDQLATDQEQGLTTTASLYQFDTEHDQLFSFAPLADLITYRIVPRGGTALLDAIGTAFVKEGEKLAAMPEDERPGSVIVLVETDGKENSSKEYTKPQIAATSAEQQEKYGWVIVYNGANQDSFAEAGSMGIAASATMDYAARGHQVQLGLGFVPGFPGRRRRRCRVHRRGAGRR
jgi:uncharacterized protein YegL